MPSVLQNNNGFVEKQGKAQIMQDFTQSEKSIQAIAESLKEIEVLLGSGLDIMRSDVTTFLTVPLTLGVMLVGIFALIQTNKTINLTRLMAEDVQLENLYREFSSKCYALRFWQLQDWICKNSIALHSLDTGALKSYCFPPETEKALNDALGLDSMSERRDMLEFYDFALRLDAWLNRYPKKRSDRISHMNDYFGRELVGTLVRHRLISCTLKKGDEDSQYYPRHYGLLDKKYTALTKDMLKDLKDREKLPTAWYSLWSKFNDDVERHVEDVLSKK